MKSNFGTRWEGQTRWLALSDGSLAPASAPLDAVYQLEFPRDDPDVGTWRGWGVVSPGDGPRVVPLSEATVIERQRDQGSTTFQFDGVGGRCSLRCDGGVWAAEVNFFHGERRSGLVVYLKSGAEGEGAGAEAGVSAASLMSMSFRKAQLSADGNLTFVDGREPTRASPHTFADAASANEAHTFANEEWRPEAAAAGRCMRLEEMRTDDYAIRVADAAAPDMSPWRQRCRDPVLHCILPDGVRCCLPTEWPLPDSACLAFGCDFRPIGGPFRSLSMQYSGGKLMRWCCEDWV